MPKITVHGGPTNKHDPAPPVPEPESDNGTAHELTGTGHALPPAEEHEGQLMEFDPATGEAHPVDDDDSTKDPQAPEVPARNASLEVWKTYVEAITGQTVPADVTRAELIELYG